MGCGGRVLINENKPSQKIKRYEQIDRKNNKDSIHLPISCLPSLSLPFYHHVGSSR